ncbi:MAG: 2-oxoglutarate/2-oxoacid ferredoxin oxidoreductase subunit beta [Thermoanaerobaculia bacterium]|jgi:2-oxoglutarate ferredoxin oxidoreductase subunit beta|nr:2-oxoglutarate/2-oxoacid ferredoxin oxidoreductase subunit beta [Thermoanaerobaculia bacterium]
MAESTLKTLNETAVPKENRLGLKALDYQGGKSTLCAGCGHDAVSNQIVRAFYEMNVKPEMVAKFSGIGCSSKTPAYFLGRAHGFNSVHGRMPAVATGAMLANHHLVSIGVSGDGDTASIGLGQFMHMVRRNIPMIYIIENNGVYGLTKGQFSATADEGSKLKTGVVNDLPPMDLCALAVELGCGFVARGYAGDPKQMVNILKAAIAHDGLAVIDVISPCVTFNNHDGSTKGYAYSKEHDELLHQIGFVQSYEQIEIDYEPGTVREVTLHDGSRLILKKLEEDYDPSNAVQALSRSHKAIEDGAMLTGLIYLQPEKKSFTSLLNMGEKPLCSLMEADTRPPKEALDQIMRELM